MSGFVLDLVRTVDELLEDFLVDVQRDLGGVFKWPINFWKCSCIGSCGGLKFRLDRLFSTVSLVDDVEAKRILLYLIEIGGGEVGYLLFERRLQRKLMLMKFCEDDDILLTSGWT